MAKIAQTSIRFRRFEITEGRFRELGPTMDKAAADVARRIYRETVTIDVYLEAGSLIVRITVIGGLLLGTYHSVAEYKDFKAGIVELIKDAEKYGTAIYQEVLKLTRASKADSVVKRKMTPGKILRVIEKLERLQEVRNELPRRSMQQQLEEIARDVKAIERDLEPEETEVLHQQLELRGLPPLAEWPKPAPSKRVEIPPVAVRERQTELIGRPTELQIQEKRIPLRYHNRFPVDQQTTSARRPNLRQLRDDR